VAAIEKDQSPANLTRQLNIIRDSERNFIRAVQEDMARNMNRGITVAPGGAPGGASARPKQIRYDIDGNPIK
jgi:hypothetical protein